VSIDVSRKCFLKHQVPSHFTGIVDVLMM